MTQQNLEAQAHDYYHNKKFAQNLVNSYIYDYFFYEGSEEEIAQKLNLVINTYQPDFLKDDKGNLKHVDASKIQQLRMRSYALHETTIASTLAEQLERIYKDRDTFYMLATNRVQAYEETVKDTYDWVNQSKDLFFPWPENVKTEITDAQLQALIVLGAQTRKVSAGAQSENNTNKSFVTTVANNTPSKFFGYEISPGTYSSLYIPLERVVKKPPSWYTNFKAGTLDNDSPAAQTAKGWFNDAARTAFQAGPAAGFALPIAKWAAGFFVTEEEQIELDRLAEELEESTDLTNYIEKILPSVYEYTSAFEGQDGFNKAMLKTTGLEVFTYEELFRPNGEIKKTKNLEIAAGRTGRLSDRGITEAYKDPQSLYVKYFPGESEEPHGSTMTQWIMSRIASLASVFPELLLQSIKDVVLGELEDSHQGGETFENTYDTPADTPWTKEPLEAGIAGLQPFDYQCFLLENIRAIATTKDELDYVSLNNKSGYAYMGRIANTGRKSQPGNLVSYINHADRSDVVQALHDLCPDIYALLVPHIKVYRVDYKSEDKLVPWREMEIPFPNFIDPNDLKNITDMNNGRYSGAGIKSFTWRLDGVNPAEVENNISANLVLYFQTVQDLFSLNQKMGSGDATQAGYLDLIIGSSTATREKPVSPQGGARAPLSHACFDAQHEEYKQTNYRIKICAGWSTPPGFANMVNKMKKPAGAPPNYGELLQQAINETRTALYLQHTEHELTFNENGSVELSINYQASLSGILRAPNADVFTGGTQYSERLAELEKKLKGINRDIDRGRSAANTTSDTTDSAEVEEFKKQKSELLDQITELMREDKATKYKRFLCNLYDSGKIYSYSVPSSDFKLLKDLDPDERVRVARSRIAKNSYLAGYNPQSADSADIDAAQAVTDRTIAISQAAGDAQDKELLEALNEQWAVKQLKNSTSDTIDIPFFYLGDFINSILGYLQTIVVDPNALNGSFQLLTSNVELLDPLVAFQVSRVGVKCPDAEKLLVTRALSEVNPLRFTGLNDLKFTTNIASLPISLDYFQEWFINTVVRPQKEQYPFLTFIKHVCSALLSKSFNSTCFGDQLNFHLRFDTALFNFADSFVGRNVTAKKLAKSNRSALTKGCEQFDRSLRPTVKPVIPSLVLYSVDSPPKSGPPNSQDLYQHDLDMGIYHYYLGASCGIAKKITFERQGIPYYREARIQRTSALSAVQLRELYNANIQMVGNTLHRNGQYIYVNPMAIGVGSARAVGTVPNLAKLLGIGGYYMISRVVHTISSAGFDVSIEGIQEGSAGEAGHEMSLSVLKTVDGDALDAPRANESTH